MVGVEQMWDSVWVPRSLSRHTRFRPGLPMTNPTLVPRSGN